jgi:hypothetical protein
MEEKSKEINSAADSLSSFIQQFGADDVVNRIIAEELLKFLMEAKKENHAPTTN